MCTFTAGLLAAVYLRVLTRDDEATHGLYVCLLHTWIYVCSILELVIDVLLSVKVVCFDPLKGSVVVF